MTSELDPIDFSDYFPNTVASDWYSNFLTVNFFDSNPHAFNGVTFYLGPDENVPDFLQEMLQEAPPTQLFGPPLSPPAVSGALSAHHQAAIEPANSPVRSHSPYHERAREDGLAFPDDTYLPITIPTIPPRTLPFPLTTTFPTNWVKIPQRIYGYGCKQPDFSQLKPTFFSTKDHLGINLGNAFRNKLSHLDGGDDRVLQDSRSPSISCRLLFPGYPSNGSSCQIHALNWTKKRVPITRGKLAREVAKKVKKYLTCMEGIAPDPSLEGHWRVGQGFMHIDSMYLVSLVSVSRGSFQPEIWVATSSVSHARAENGRY